MVQRTARLVKIVRHTQFALDTTPYIQLILDQPSPGRIKNIIDFCKDTFETESIVKIPGEEKLKILCEYLQLSYSDFDKLISENPQAFRTIKGHAFESVFDYMLRVNGYDIEEIGGDSSVDRIVNGHTLQLKTPTMAGTKGSTIQYKTHKTHGAKSEEESLEYYHQKSTFADFLVGHISYNPFRVIFLKNEDLPTHPLDDDRIISPFNVEWPNHEGLNAFELIDVNSSGIDTYDILPRSQELLPDSSTLLGLRSEIIIDTILNENNFRIWDMNLRGFARETAFVSYLESKNITVFDPAITGKTRSEKVDISLNLKNSPDFVHLQVKGLTFSSSIFSGEDSLIDIESQLSRGRVNDHPTQSRLYLETDFDYLLLSLDPSYSAKLLRETGYDPIFEWQFFAIPTEDLRRHHKYQHRIASHQRKLYSDLQEYRIDDEWLSYFD